jgi:hypothetical protein
MADNDYGKKHDAIFGPPAPTVCDFCLGETKEWKKRDGKTYCPACERKAVLDAAATKGRSPMFINPFRVDYSEY